MVKPDQPPAQPEQRLPGTTYLPYLRAWRIHRGMTLEALEQASGVGRTTVYEVEALRRKATATTYGKLARALRIKPTALLYMDPEDLESPEETGAA